MPHTYPVGLKPLDNAYHPIGFSSRIKLVTPAEFQAVLGDEFVLQANGEFSDYPWTLQQRVIGKTQGATMDADNCNIIGATNEQQVNLAHLWPKQVNGHLATVKKTLIADIQQHLQTNNQPVRVLIAAGQGFQGTAYAPYYVPSTLLFKTLLQVAIEGPIDAVSIIWGRARWERKCSTSVSYRAAEDTWYLKFHYDDTVRLSDLQGTFQKIYIAEGDVLEAADQTIAGPRLIQNNPLPAEGQDIDLQEIIQQIASKRRLQDNQQEPPAPPSLFNRFVRLFRRGC